jgi:hypothetical protein
MIVLMTTKREDEKRAREVRALAASEASIHERLLSIRGELDLISHAIDRITVPRRPRMRADLLNILPFNRRGRL